MLAKTGPWSNMDIGASEIHALSGYLIHVACQVCDMQKKWRLTLRSGRAHNCTAVRVYRGTS